LKIKSIANVAMISRLQEAVIGMDDMAANEDASFLPFTLLKLHMKSFSDKKKKDHKAHKINRTIDGSSSLMHIK
jgi:hypothetical protein